LFSYASHAVSPRVAGNSAKSAVQFSERKAPQAGSSMTLAHIHNAIEMTTHPKLSQLLELLIEHGGLAVGSAAPLLDQPHFMVLRFANRLAYLGYATLARGTYFPTISGREIDAVMQGRLR
jgi:hypothetical protein